MTQKRTGGVSVPPEVLALLDPAEAKKAKRRRYVAAANRELHQKKIEAGLEKVSTYVPQKRAGELKAIAAYMREHPDVELGPPSD